MKQKSMYHSDYKKMLESPEWKLKKTEILSRDKCCQYCGAVENLEVHHIFYLKNLKPYNYHNNLLIVLCRRCHQLETDYNFKIVDFINYMKYLGMLSFEIFDLFFDHLYDNDFDNFNKDMNDFRINKL